MYMAPCFVKACHRKEEQKKFVAQSSGIVEQQQWALLEEKKELERIIGKATNKLQITYHDGRRKSPQCHNSDFEIW